MPRGQSSSSSAMIVVIVAVLLLGVPMLLCGGCMFLGFAVGPTPVGPPPTMQTIPVDDTRSTTSDSLQPTTESDVPTDDSTETPDAETAGESE